MSGNVRTLVLMTRWGAIVVLGLTAAGCSAGDDDGDVTDGGMMVVDFVPLEADIALWSYPVGTRGYLTFAPTPVHPLCDHKEWLALGECTAWTDGPRCSPRPPSPPCPLTLSAERDGVVLAVKNDVDRDDYAQLLIDDVRSPGLDLVIVSCGRMARLPLVQPDDSSLAIQRLSRRGDDLIVDWLSVAV